MAGDSAKSRITQEKSLCNLSFHVQLPAVFDSVDSMAPVKQHVSTRTSVPSKMCKTCRLEKLESASGAHLDIAGVMSMNEITMIKRWFIAKHHFKTCRKKAHIP